MTQKRTLAKVSRAPKREQVESRTYGTGRVTEVGGRWRAVVDVSMPGDLVRRRSTKTFDKKSEAEKWIKQTAGNRANGVATAQPVAQQKTTAQYLTEWLAGPDVTTDRLTQSTQRQYAQVVRAYLIPTLGHHRLASLTPQKVSAAWVVLAAPGAVASLKTGRARQGDMLSPSTVALARRTLRAALTCAVREGELPSNPCSLSKLPYKSGTIKPKPDPISAADLARLEACWMEHRIGPLLRFSLATGLRQGELLALRTTDIDAVARTIHVHRNLSRKLDGSYELTDQTKTESSKRILGLGFEAEEALKAERSRQAAERLKAGSAWHDNELVFATPIGTPRNPRNTSRDWHKLLEEAGIDRRRFHTLRHSYATYLLTGGLPKEVVSKILGHSSQAVTMSTYAEVTERLTAPAAGIIDAALRNAR